MRGLLDMDWGSQKVRLLDGAMGTELRRRGCPENACVEKWASEHPDTVASIHRDYIESGAEIIYTCTFGANRARFGRHGLADQTVEINQKLSAIARKSVSSGIIVAGDIGPTGRAAGPSASISYAELHNIFTEQVDGLVAGGVDLLVIETMTWFREARTALVAAKKRCDLPVMVTLTFSEQGDIEERFGHADVCHELQELGAVAVGCNCSPDASRMVEIIAGMKRVAQVPLLAKPSAGIPTVKNGRLIYPYSPEEFVAQCKNLIEAGATLIGGCCGTSPKHIALLRQSLTRWRERGD